MFTYSDEYNENLDFRRKKVADSNNDLIDNIKSLLSLSPCCLITKELSIGYVSAIEK